jgi:hypothetical protein
MLCGDGMYEVRDYRDTLKESQLKENICIVEETDLMIFSSDHFNEKNEVKRLRGVLKDYISKHKEFEVSLKPLPFDLKAPTEIQHMLRASKLAGVGPMATVAGMISHYLGIKMHCHEEVMIENGGDIYLKAQTKKIVGIYAGQSPFSNQVAIKIQAEETPIGICTSSGSLGHSLSFGNADAVVVLSKDTLLADAVATAIGNQIKTSADIKKGLEFGRNIEGIIGVVIIVGDELGAFGDIELVSRYES